MHIVFNEVYNLAYQSQIHAINLPGLGLERLSPDGIVQISIETYL
jgi:hypothetical protein